MVTKAEDLWECSKCHNLQNRTAPWHPDDVCEICHEKEETRWHAQLDLLHKLVGRDPDPDQTGCFHNFIIVPKSGKRFGIKLWVCENCEKVVQAS